MNLFVNLSKEHAVICYNHRIYNNTENKYDGYTFSNIMEDFVLLQFTT